jgi:hypothetical protein
VRSRPPAANPTANGRLSHRRQPPADCIGDGQFPYRPVMLRHLRAKPVPGPEESSPLIRLGTPRSRLRGAHAGWARLCMVDGRGHSHQEVVPARVVVARPGRNPPHRRRVALRRAFGRVVAPGLAITRRRSRCSVAVETLPAGVTRATTAGLRRRRALTLYRLPASKEMP